MTPSPDLLSLEVSLQPAAPAPGDRPPPKWWGKAVHRLLLDVLRQADPALSARWHDHPGPKPFTASSLSGYPRQPALRLTTLNAEIAAILLQATQPGGPLAPQAAIELDGFLFTVASCETQSATYGQLAGPRLTALTPAPDRISLEFLSPTTFRSLKIQRPLPEPELVFGSLLERWNEFSPLALPDELKAYAAGCVSLSRFDLHSRAAAIAGGVFIGFVGTVTFTGVEYDPRWMSALALLADFACYSGVGAKTAMGLGQCRMV